MYHKPAVSIPDTKQSFKKINLFIFAHAEEPTYIQEMNEGHTCYKIDHNAVVASVWPHKPGIQASSAVQNRKAPVCVYNPITNNPILPCPIVAMECKLRKQAKRRIEAKNSLGEGQFHYWEVIMQEQGSDQSMINILIIHLLPVHLN